MSETTGRGVTFIGDVHGWSDRLDRLLAQVSGRLVFLGDLIDRGPDAPGVLDRVHALCSAGTARCVLGNHEWMLIRALGRGDGPGNTDAFIAWIANWGGHAVLQAYGVDTAAALKDRLAPHWAWLCALPWVLHERHADGGWIAVHAGLVPHRPWRQQVAELEAGPDGPWRDAVDQRPLPLFSKHLVESVPDDLPSGWCVASGHTPLVEAYATDQRICCDTSGGRPDRALSAVRWPDHAVFTGLP